MPKQQLVQNPVPAGRPALPVTTARWMALMALATMAPPAAAQGCTAWSAAQLAKFRLALAQACAAPAAAEAPRAAAALQLFDAQGAATRSVPPLARQPVPPQPASALPRSSEPLPATSPLPMKFTPVLAPDARRAMQLAPLVDDTARRHDIDPLLLHAIAHVESRHDAMARSPAGARGLMQVMPMTARRFGVQAESMLNEPAANLEVSATYLKLLQRRFDGDLPLVLAAYNAGEGAVERHGRRIPPYAETRGYVQQVMQRYRWLAGFVQRQPAQGLQQP